MLFPETRHRPPFFNFLMCGEDVRGYTSVGVVLLPGVKEGGGFGLLVFVFWATG